MKERKYNENNIANAEYHIPLIKIREAIKCYIKSKPKLIKHYNFNYKSQCHDLDLILDECIEKVKNGNAYRLSKRLPKSTLNFHYQNLHKRNILRGTYEELLKEYFKKGANRKLLYRYKDTTYIVNKNGKENVKYNGYKKRNGTKVSMETDSNGVVIHSTINDGNIHDAKIFINDTT